MTAKSSGSSTSARTSTSEQEKPTKAAAKPKAASTSKASKSEAVPKASASAAKAAAAPAPKAGAQDKVEATVAAKAMPAVQPPAPASVAAPQPMTAAAAPTAPAAPVAKQPPAGAQVDKPALAAAPRSSAPGRLAAPLPAWAARLDPIKSLLPKDALDWKVPARQPAGMPVQTGTGAMAVIALERYQPQKLGADVVTPIKVSVTYEDKAGYFAGAQDVKAWAQLEACDGRPAATVDELPLTKQADGRYVGTTLIAPAAEGTTELKEAAIAFTGDGKWDSNMGANYRIGL